jgi:DNA helicase IV
MASEKWFTDITELDEFQMEIRELEFHDSFVIKGCAGSGKTILAIHRANDIKINAIAEGKLASFTMIVRTKALQSFIKAGIKAMGIGPRQLIYPEQWDHTPVEYIIIDEAQDFSKEQITEFYNLAESSIMLYGDSEQLVYKNGLSTSGIAVHLSLQEKELSYNYRLPKPIAAFASYLGDPGLANKCVKKGGDKPKLIRFNHWTDELDFIIEEIETRNYTDSAILLPFNDKSKGRYNNFHRNVEDVIEYFDSKDFKFEFKMNDEMSLNFESDLPKLMAYHSSKGLQFETVFIPFCDYPCHDNWFITKYTKPLYVALTRTFKNLYITHSERITPFFDTIPSTNYVSY